MRIEAALSQVRRTIAGAGAALFLLGLPILAHAQVRADARPQRIVSLNLCTDELLLYLVPPERIASISFLSQQPQNAPPGFEQAVKTLDINHGLAEQVVAEDPDLVVAGSFAARPTVNLLRRLGYAVVDFEPETSFDDLRANIRRMGEAVGEVERADRLIARFDARLARLQARIPAGDYPTYADIGVNNWMAGNDTLRATIANAGGYRTLGQTMGYSGYRYIPLEVLAQSKPALVTNTTPWEDPPSLSTDGLRHPAIGRLAGQAMRISIRDRAWVCGSPAVLDIVERLVETREALATKIRP